MARGMVVDRDTFRVQSTAIAGAWILAELIYACLIGRTFAIRFAFW